ncbi:hypothetical protein CY34DRAFT_461763 [Suillus luteus UH-Slu-Lm8-n1]|uniref:C2H2-type domain-containing protein n=1 Tax=Suillus luteus UH-Slu-Lm8-n1 TaxID=930992 RepID=A0A0D0AZZ4_9AGAM|nr:hypothetical protein CY34DRAFT_461763 [Suillus luteus UH-Slu-Lm8-n1]
MTQNHQGHVFATGFAPHVAPQAPRGRRAIYADPLFAPILDEHGQPNGTFKCLKDGTVLKPDNYRKHLATARHRGKKLEKYACPVCLRTFGRLDACERHYDSTSPCGRSRAGLPRPSFSAVPAAGNSNLVPPVVVPTMAFGYQAWSAMPVPQYAQTALPAEHAEDDEADDAEFYDRKYWEKNELDDQIRDEDEFEFEEYFHTSS